MNGSVIMNLQQLYYFIDVVKLKHITRAAELNHISQSTLSTAIKNLETELGVALIEKSGRGIEITEHGKIFYKYVEDSLRSLNNGVKQIEELKREQGLVVKLATTFSLGSSTLPNLISVFSKEFPQVHIRIIQGTNKYINKKLLLGEVDFVLGRLAPMPVDDNIEYKSIFTENINLLIPSGHRLSNRSEVCITELKDEPIILFDESTGFKQEVIEACSRFGFYPNVVYEAVDNGTVAALVEEGLGIAFIAKMGGINNDKCKVVPIAGNSMKSTVCLYWSNKYEKLDGAVELMKFFKEHYSDVEHVIE